jgi:two-component system, LuxR family, response regulator DctR
MTVGKSTLAEAPGGNGQVYLVDDDEAIRDSLSLLFRSRGVNVSTFSSGEAFLAALDGESAGCIVLDIRMGGASGIAVFDDLRGRHCRLPVIFLTGHGDVPMAVTALKKGAFDFVEKPFNDNELVDRVLHALVHDARARDAQLGEATVAARLGTLSPREREVMGCVLQGKLNKVIADELAISMRTVEVHRARIFAKMGVKSAVELAQLLARAH